MGLQACRCGGLNLTDWALAPSKCQLRSSSTTSRSFFIIFPPLFNPTLTLKFSLSSSYVCWLCMMTLKGCIEVSGLTSVWKSLFLWFRPWPAAQWMGVKPSVKTVPTPSHPRMHQKLKLKKLNLKSEDSEEEKTKNPWWHKECLWHARCMECLLYKGPITMVMISIWPGSLTWHQEKELSEQWWGFWSVCLKMMAAPNVHCSKWCSSSRWQSRWRLSHFGMSFVLEAASSSQRYGICKRHSCSLFDRRPKQFLWMGILREFWFNLKIVTEMMEDFCRQWVWNPTTSPQLHSLQSKTNQVSNYFQRQPMLVWFKNYPAWN